MSETQDAFDAIAKEQMEKDLSKEIYVVSKGTDLRLVDGRSIDTRTGEGWKQLAKYDSMTEAIEEMARLKRGMDKPTAAAAAGEGEDQDMLDRLCACFHPRAWSRARGDMVRHYGTVDALWEAFCDDPEAVVAAVYGLTTSNQGLFEEHLQELVEED